ncbi:hypothetical protein Pyn_38294 [Prunus yedoensis var. nudiflora]|uniref:Uncharacterized protein n=1 Tax=Prunus yedoensis var. nudiflora TaxID=2094558 RepID=A0A314YA93_PRUYE|nr:hypothetical protein Pyn_38294 [Prunus yedoensis var. nudiflora]
MSRAHQEKPRGHSGPDHLYTDPITYDTLGISNGLLKAEYDEAKVGPVIGCLVTDPITRHRVPNQRSINETAWQAGKVG